MPETPATTAAEVTTTVAPTTAAPTTTAAPIVTTTAVPTQTVAGTVDVLDQVGFIGSIDGEQPFAPQVGNPCAGRGGYADLAPGAPVIISSGEGLPLATTTLISGTTVSEVKSTASERAKREELVNSIYELRIAKVDGDPVAVAQLRLARAELRLRDLETPGPPPAFEGLPFYAQWCRLTFSSPPVPEHAAYQITVTHRGSTMFTSGQLPAALVVD